MRRGSSFPALALLPLLAQTESRPAFDIASVKPTSHGQADAQGFTHSDADMVSPGRFAAENSSLDELIRWAYNLQEYQVAGPAWLNDKNVCFDIQAKAPAATTKERMRVMLQTLLIDRFHLRAHNETRQRAIYELVVGKTAPKLKPADPASQRSVFSAGGSVQATKVTMDRFVVSLASFLNQPVFNKTGIDGAYDISFKYALDQDTSSTAPSLFTAIKETTGLILRPAKGPVEVLVIDQIDRSPTAN